MGTTKNIDSSAAFLFDVPGSNSPFMVQERQIGGTESPEKQSSERMSAMSMKHITCIEDLRQRHRQKVPKAFFDYADRGSYAEETLRANRDELQKIKFRQRILVDVSRRDLSTKILGEPASLPLILAPVGLTGMQFGDGEIHACRAAQSAGIPYTLSTMSICSIEDVAANVENPFWFQLYVMKDRGFIKALIERAIAAKCSALVLTVDLQVIGPISRTA
jgi:L-lactate dehydrogenase (cytochrome)